MLVKFELSLMSAINIANVSTIHLYLVQTKTLHVLNDMDKSCFVASNNQKFNENRILTLFSFFFLLKRIDKSRKAIYLYSKYMNCSYIG